MIRASERMAELERRYEREAFRGLTYDEALRWFVALWSEALSLNPDLGEDWRDDIEPDLAIARAINGLPPAR